jgi:hypothetical protein
MIKPIIVTSVVLLCAVGAQAQETQRQYLSGKGNDDAIPWEFFCSAGAKSGQWTTIPVPSCWDALGYGTLNYFKDGDQPERGKYRHRFTAPESWRGQRIILVFDGVLTDAQASVNGKPAGAKHQGGFYRFSYDVTELVKFGDGGENLLEVTVDKHSANESINRAERQGDYWMFGGIFRPVWIEARPPQHVERIAIDAKADGSIAIDTFLSGVTSAERVEAQVLTTDGANVGEAFAAKVQDSKARLGGKVDSPKQWTAETPNLYVVEVRLLEGEQVVHRVLQRFGFRTIEVRPADGFHVNGKRVLLKGANRHSFWPESGRTTSERISRADVRLIKEMNHNAVRMSHYPPDEHFLYVCDEEGLYVLDELAGWQKSYDTETARRLVSELVRRDVNHPSILFWDNGNEGGWNNDVNDDFAKWDPQRRAVLHPWEPFRGINTKHYTVFEQHVKLCAGPDVYMPTEFLHGLYDGGHGAGLAEYWEAIRTSKVGGGGLLWSLVDETVKRPDTGKLDTNGNMAPDGIVGPYREKEGSFYAIKELWSPVVVRRVGGFVVENRYNFTNTKDCTFTWQLRKFRSPRDGKAGHEVMSEWKQAIEIPAGGKANVIAEVPASAKGKLADAIALRVDDPRGRQLWTWVWPIAEPEIDPVTALSSTPRHMDGRDLVTLSSGDLSLTFTRKTGGLEEVRRGEARFPLSKGPRLAVGEAMLIDLAVKTDGPDAVLDATYDGDLKRVTWRLRNDGWAQLDYAYALRGSFDYFGVGFELPEDEVKSVRWLGKGPYPVWKNRLAGGVLDVWEKAYNDTITGHSGFEYPEFKGYHAGVRWMRIDTTAGPIVVVIDEPEKAFVQLLRPKFPGDPKPLSPTTAATQRARTSKQLSANAWAPFPDAGFSILHAIPAMGNKFHLASETGPAGQQNVAKGDYKGRVRFYFGEQRQ